MEGQDHIIQQQVLDISFPIRSEAHQLQNRISELFNSRINREIATLFDRLIPAERHLQIDNLTVDAGTLPLHWRDDELEELVLSALEREILQLLALPYTLPQANEPEPHFQTSNKTNYIAFLEYFLLTGTLPWWATGDVMADPVKVFYRLLNEDKESLKELILNTGRFAHVRRRLVYQFAPEIIKSVITILEPDQADFIFDYHTDTVKIQRQKNVVKTESSELEKELWLFILTYLFADRGTTFNRKAFVKAAIGQMAQHYNLKYLELLALFSEVLANAEINLKTSSYLPVIIKELRYEEFIHINQHPPADNENSVSDDRVQPALQDLNIIRYFLVFGSLPWWAEPCHPDQLSAIFIRLIKSVPQSLNEMVTTVGKLQDVRKRIIVYFDEEIYTELVTVIEPANADLIIDYADEMYSLQVKNSIIKADSKEFKSVLWELIFGFLLAERGSVFNANSFLEFNIRKIAQVYHIRYADLLAFIIQGVTQAHKAESKHVQFFQMLTGLLTNLIQAEEKATGVFVPGDGSEDSVPIDQPGKLKGQAGEDESDRVEQILLRNILLHWLTYGAMPWWAAGYRHRQIDELFEKLIAEVPDVALALLKFAGQADHTRQRMIYQLPEQTLAKLFALLPSGEPISGLVSQLLQLFGNAFINANPHQVNHDLEKQLFLIWWNINIARNYTGADISEFIIAAIDHIADYTGQKAEILFLQTRESVRSSSRNDRYNQLIIKALDGARHHNINQMRKRYHSSGSLAYLTAADIILTYLSVRNKEPLHSDVLEEAVQLLQFFLTHKRLPSRLNHISGLHVDAFLKQLMVMLYYEHPEALIALLRTGNHHHEARMHLHDLFITKANAGEVAVARLLDSLLEQDILKFIKDESPGSLITEADLVAYVKDRFLRSGSPEAAEPLKTLLEHVSVAGYLAYQLADKDVYQLMDKAGQASGWRSETIDFAKELQHFFQSLITDSLERERLGALFREFNLLLIGGHYSFSQPEGYLVHLLKFIASRRCVLIKTLSALVADAGKHTFNLSTGMSALLPEIIEQLQTNSHDIDRQRSWQQSNNADDEAVMQNIYNKPSEKHLREEMQSIKKELGEDQDRESLTNTEKDSTMNGESIYIQNAGLVLLQPFFATYFKRLGMLEGNDFIDLKARLRAVHLLQYLVAGIEKHPEQELPLNKILCNVPLQEAVPMEVVLTEQEKQVSAQLLHAVINNWDKLKNTSIEGLRASFLQRTGVLTWKGDSWNLRVEQRGYDVLLQTLPWNISMIKTSWMTNFLYVEWI